ncbi:MAG: hypothetical protein IPL98_07600 [Saprospiraceae bacterium]|nr:hypothetical protein [Saprospiraceae bacterium]
MAYSILAYTIQLKPKGISATYALDQMRSIYKVDIEIKKDKKFNFQNGDFKKDQAILKTLGLYKSTFYAKKVS